MGFEELKVRQSAAWGAAPFERVAGSIADVRAEMVERLAPRPGERWLDVACGTGELARLVARTGAAAAGVDFAPELIETARRQAAEEGVEVAHEVGDAERLRFAGGAFDGVVSTFGVVFAPDHAAAAGELARVTRPGGRLGLANWRPDGSVGDFFRLLASFQPPPPGAGRPVDWGLEEHVSDLLGGAFELEFDIASSPQTGASGEEIWELFSASFGPLKALHDSLEPERREELHRVCADFWEGYRTADGIFQPRAYLIVVGTRR